LVKIVHEIYPDRKQATIVTTAIMTTNRIAEDV
jgi:hypothetical protein